MIRLNRILLVEDSENDIELTLSVLEEHRIASEIIVARDGVEALDCLFRRGKFANDSEEAPGLILLDMKMPKVSGLEVLREIKSDPHLRRIPVVVLTSSREEQDVIQSYDLGVNAYVVKPVDFQQFVDSVKQIGLFWAVINEPFPGSGGRPIQISSNLT